jgi:hypothetical protein
MTQAACSVKHLCPAAIALAIVASTVMTTFAQTRPAGPTATDIYHVMFVKAQPGQAAALAKELQQQDPKDPMASHFVLLRHQEGDDWDYCLIQHVGPTATVAITPPTPPANPPTTAWHNDTFVAGPAWAEFSKLMNGPSTSVYVVGVHRAVPGHRDQLREVLNRPDPAAKVPVSRVTLAHLEGGTWQFVSVDRYNSWQDFGTDRTGTAAGGEGWLEVRQHSASHSDTIADRVTPK